ncbi:ribonuclease HII [gamma proteobacterium HTCC5015]|nr:ribonuclease HII [gamma proteobacterium HTCC5015]
MAVALPPITEFDHLPNIAGADEAGRGPLAGSVVAAAVVLDPKRPIPGLNDSKKLSEKRREALYEEICAEASDWCIARASVEEIDDLNILHASMLAMKRAIEGLQHPPEQALIDGNRCPDVSMPAQAIVKGDGRVACIGAASILAKVARDRDMLLLHEAYPDYGFDRHKGYPTALHQERLKALGPTEHHRRSFGPVKKCLSSV